MSNRVSVEALESALRSLVARSRSQLHVRHDDVLQLFWDTASDLENLPRNDDHQQDTDLRVIGDLFRSMRKS